jgi:hypothetical protein
MKEKEPHTPEYDDRALVRRFVLIFFSVLVIVALGIAIAMSLRPGPADYHANPANNEQRLALIARAEQQLATLTGDDAESRIQRDTARIAIAIQKFAIKNNGRLPRTLTEAGIAPDDIEPGIRYSYGSRYWRLFQENNRVLARGN